MMLQFLTILSLIFSLATIGMKYDEGSLTREELKLELKKKALKPSSKILNNLVDRPARDQKGIIDYYVNKIRSPSKKISYLFDLSTVPNFIWQVFSRTGGIDLVEGMINEDTSLNKHRLALINYYVVRKLSSKGHSPEELISDIKNLTFPLSIYDWLLKSSFIMEIDLYKIPHLENDLIEGFSRLFNGNDEANQAVYNEIIKLTPKKFNLIAKLLKTMGYNYKILTTIMHKISYCDAWKIDVLHSYADLFSLEMFLSDVHHIVKFIYDLPVESEQVVKSIKPEGLSLLITKLKALTNYKKEHFLLVELFFNNNKFDKLMPLLGEFKYSEINGFICIKDLIKALLLGLNQEQKLRMLSFVTKLTEGEIKFLNDCLPLLNANYFTQLNDAYWRIKLLYHLKEIASDKKYFIELLKDFEKHEERDYERLWYRLDRIPVIFDSQSKDGLKTIIKLSDEQFEALHERTQHIGKINLKLLQFLSTLTKDDISFILRYLFPFFDLNTI